MNQLLEILNTSTCWNNIYLQLLERNANRKKATAGKLFEEFCKYYYLSEPLVRSEYKHVWLFSEIPSDVRKKLNLGKIDHGIDLLLEDHVGKFSVVQCKFRNNQTQGICWSKDKLANLFADGDKADSFIVFTNASRIDSHSLNKKENQLKIVTLGDLLCISRDTINIMKHLIQGEPVLLEKPKTPRDYQKIAIGTVLAGFRNNDRGQLILPCGAGKTLTALWIKEELKSKHTLLLFPSLALLRQTKNEWSKNSKHYSPYICVCSEKDIDKKSDDIEVHTYEITGQVSTDPTVIRDFLTTNNETIVYSTYQSLEAISIAIKSTGFEFDLVICDEAHKTSGNMLGAFALIHDNELIPAKKRLYMTATPTILTTGLKNKLGEERLKYVAVMDNPTIFGPEFYRMSFADAIENDILVNYRITAIGISNEELSKAIEERRYINKNESIDEIANNYALENFMQEQNAAHAITFHSTVKKAQSFQERHQDIFPKTNSYHVNGSLTTNDRAVLMNQFAHASKAIITNARCLTEGVDVPAIDVVYFCDPKYSKIDIVQAVGRALRRNDNKELGHIIVPIFHYEETKLEEEIVNKSFNNLVNVIRALCAHDSRLVAEISTVKFGKGELSPRSKQDSIVELSTLLAFQGFENCLQENLFHQVISKITVPWITFEEARSLVHALGLENKKQWDQYIQRPNKLLGIPSDPYTVYKKTGWQTWGDWLGTNTIAPRKMKFRIFEKARDFARSLNLKTTEEWREYAKSNKRPKDIPSCPNETYENDGWISMPDWLGIDKAPVDRNFLNFEEAKSIARSLNLKSSLAWKRLSKNKCIPKGLPANPHDAYRNTGWISWMDFLGTKNVNYKKITFLPFEEALAFARSLNLESLDEWNEYCKSGNKPSNIPTGAYTVYKGKGWDSWPDWLGTSFWDFEKSKAFISHLKLKNYLEWIDYCKSGNKPKYIPRTPDRVYKKQWHSWGDWLSTDNPSHEAKEFRDFNEAREYARSLGLKNGTDWRKFISENKKPHDIPSAPDVFYKDQGWVNWPDWLGTKTISSKNRIYLSFEDARDFVHTLKLTGENAWRKYCKSGAKTLNIPAKPERVYKKNWISWPNWLGTKTISPKNRTYLSFEDARTFVHTLKLHGESSWRKYCKGGIKPGNIPSKPERVYKSKGWISWPNWLRTHG